jgi:hypothetical protein
VPARPCLAAHGRIHPSNPLFTSLTFAGGPLTVYDLNQLRRAPHLVVLAACHMGRPTVRSGDELLGLIQNGPGRLPNPQPINPPCRRSGNWHDDPQSIR